MRSFSTTASTIHPDVVKARVKSALEKRGRKGQARRQVVKGEASAKTRSRRNNKDTIASSTSAFWEGWGVLDTYNSLFFRTSSKSFIFRAPSEKVLSWEERKMLELSWDEICWNLKHRQRRGGGWLSKKDTFTPQTCRFEQPQRLMHFSVFSLYSQIAL